MRSFSEVDSARYFDVDSVRKRIHKSQIGFLDRLEDKIGKIKKEKEDKQERLF